jgi:hypothetical protein
MSTNLASAQLSEVRGWRIHNEQGGASRNTKQARFGKQRLFGSWREPVGDTTAGPHE